MASFPDAQVFKQHAKGALPCNEDISEE